MKHLSRFRISVLSIVLFHCFNFYGPKVFADISRLRIVGLGGLAQSQIVGAGSRKFDVQGPIGVSGNVDYLLTGQWEVGAEHLRTVSARNGTAVGLTGIAVKNYFWFSHPQTQITEQDMHSQANIKMQALIPYIGVSLGIAQASILDRNIGMLGSYFCGKGGWEYPINDAWGLRVESSIAITFFGSGTANYISVLLGAYLYL